MGLAWDLHPPIGPATTYAWACFQQGPILFQNSQIPMATNAHDSQVWAGSLGSRLEFQTNKFTTRQSSSISVLRISGNICTMVGR